MSDPTDGLTRAAALLGQCESTCADCPPHDQRCVQEIGHTGVVVLHFNKAGFAWSDADLDEARRLKR